jgi:hypothetical protein
MASKLFSIPIFGGLVLGMVMVGCSKQGGTAGKTDEVRTNLRQIYRAYQMAESELRHPPKDEAELKPFLDKAGGSADSLRSPGDGEPFVIIWGVELSATGDPSGAGGRKSKPKAFAPSATEGKPDPNEPPSIPILAYEAKGTGGSRHVLLQSLGTVMVLKEDIFQKAKFAKGHKPK